MKGLGRANSTFHSIACSSSRATWIVYTFLLLSSINQTGFADQDSLIQPLPPVARNSSSPVADLAPLSVPQNSFRQAAVHALPRVEPKLASHSQLIALAESPSDDLLESSLVPVERTPLQQPQAVPIGTPPTNSNPSAPDNNQQNSTKLTPQTTPQKTPQMTPTSAWLWESHTSLQTNTKSGQVYCPQPVPSPSVPVPQTQRSIYESPWNRQDFGSLLKDIPPRPPMNWNHQQPTLVPSYEPNTIPNPSLSASAACNPFGEDNYRLGRMHSPEAIPVPFQPSDFRGTPAPSDPYQPDLDIATYFGKYFVPTQRPWVEWWRPFYTGGMYDPAKPIFSDVNPLTPHFLVYGDYRAGVGVHRNNGKHVRSLANRLNLDLDLRLTGTERIHAFTGPLDRNNQFTRLDFSDSRNVRFEEVLDFQMDTVFFEGDLGAMTGGLTGVDAPFDLPFTFGRIPLLYQNGIWMEDAITGFAFGFPWKNSPRLNWSNYDVTFFAGFNQVTSPAFNNNNHAAQVFGTAWFIEAYDGYIESDYAFLNDQDGLDRSYHNLAFAYTRRYWTRISNSIRVLGNMGQDGPRSGRSADGLLLLCENSLISHSPSNVVPYFNAFLGYGRPQSVARAAGAGGILRNTGINFESDNLTAYPTLDSTGSNSYGGALGINLLTADFRQQLAFEFAALDTYGDNALSSAAGAQYALGSRWQKALNNWTLVRLDFINGWLDHAPDLYGTRCEFRWKF